MSLLHLKSGDSASESYKHTFIKKERSLQLLQQSEHWLHKHIGSFVEYTNAKGSMYTAWSTLPGKVMVLGKELNRGEFHFKIKLNFRSFQSVGLNISEISYYCKEISLTKDMTIAYMKAGKNKNEIFGDSFPQLLQKLNEDIIRIISGYQNVLLKC